MARYAFYPTMHIPMKLPRRPLSMYQCIAICSETKPEKNSINPDKFAFFV
jgi:hypothetical protein